MITDEEIAKIYEWADKYGIMNGRRSQENWGGFGYKEWTKGIPRKKEALIKVESLKVSEEEIKELPNELFNLPNLKELDIRDCINLKNLPMNIGTLTSMALEISTFSQNIDLLRDITKLCISESYLLHYDDKFEQYKELPKEIWTLANLTSLCIMSIEVKEIKVELENLTNLKNLYIMECENLTRVPSTIKNLKKLEHLRIGACYSIVEIPKEIGSLLNLNQLELYSLSLNNIPKEIGKLLNLEILDLKHNYNLKSLPKSIKN